jgi:hypothetical protein
MSSFKWTKINFCKFAGKQMTLPQIILNDPDWFWYMFEKEAFTGALAREASDIATKAQKIRIPGKNPKRWKVLNYLTPEGAFSRFEIIRAEAASDRASAKTRVTDFIDLSLPRRLKTYDKGGGKRLIKGLKFELFGRTNVRLTKQRCEEFFADPENFG